MKMLSVEEAKGQLAALVEEAKRGEEIYIGEHGTPVLRLQPVVGRLPVFEGQPVPRDVQDAAWCRLKAAMQQGFPDPAGRFSREEIYDDRMRELEERRNRNRA